MINEQQEYTFNRKLYCKLCRPYVMSGEQGVSFCHKEYLTDEWYPEECEKELEEKFKEEYLLVKFDYKYVELKFKLVKDAENKEERDNESCL